MFLVISDKEQFSLIQTHRGLVVVGDQGPRVCLRLEWDIKAALGLSEELAFLCKHFLMLVLTCFSECLWPPASRHILWGQGSLEINSCPKGETKDLWVGFLEAFWKGLGNSYIIYQYMVSLFFKNIFLFFIIYNILTLNMFWSYSSLSPRFSRSFTPPYPPKFKFFPPKNLQK